MQEYINHIVCKDWVEALKGLPAGVFHCVVCSPPYWGQRLYWWGTDNPCDGKAIQHDWKPDHSSMVGNRLILQICRNCGAKAPLFGLEKTPEEHIQKLVEGFREVRRVLRDDGVLWVNYGPKYADKPIEIMELRPDLTVEEISYVLRELSDGMNNKDKKGYRDDD